MAATSRWHHERAVFEGQFNAESLTVTLSLALALYNAIELMLLILTTFKRRRGLYFWSLCVSNYGVVSYSVGLIIEYFQLAPLWAGMIFDISGWMFMITGQSLVLYSRLNLILDHVKILKTIKYMIIFNATVWYILIAVLDWGSTYSSNPAFAEGFFYIEYVQMTMFCLQEFIISGLYVWRTVAFLKIISADDGLTSKAESRARSRSVIWQLLIINIIIIAMDIVLLFLQWKHLRIYQQSTKAFIYAVKLKLELNILSKLVDLVSGSGQRQQTRVLDEINSHALPILDRESSQTNLQSAFAVDKHSITRHVENGHTIGPRPSAESDTWYGADAIRTQSNTSAGRYSARATGREEDVLYADMLKSIK